MSDLKYTNANLGCQENRERGKQVVMINEYRIGKFKVKPNTD